MKSKILGLLAVGLLAGPMAAQATFTTYSGLNATPTPAGTVSGDPLTKRNTMVAALSGVATENFESFQVGAVPLNLSFTGSSTTATVSGTGSVSNDTSNGRFNTTAGGSNYFEQSGAFTVAFSSAISAFGFYATDLGDFGGQLALALTDANGGITNFTLSGSDKAGSLLFWGFVDTVNTYTSIAFDILQPPPADPNDPPPLDYVGFDDMFIGTLRQTTPVPEPGTLALLGLGLAGLGLSRRRRAD